MNPHIAERLAHIRQGLLAVHRSGKPMSAASKGREREAFIDEYLTNVLPPIYRCGTGDITDAAGNISGQVDVVIENPSSPAIAGFGTKPTRLYLAEGVGAVVEVKSDLSKQWKEVLSTSEKVARLRRSLGTGMVLGKVPLELPLFVVGYTGWKSFDSFRSKFQECTSISGMLSIEEGYFLARSPGFGTVIATDDGALMGLFLELNGQLGLLNWMRMDLGRYA